MQVSWSLLIYFPSRYQLFHGKDERGIKFQMSSVLLHKFIAEQENDFAHQCLVMSSSP